MKIISALILVSVAFTQLAFAKFIERSDYKISVPDKCTVDNEDPDIDLDHMTTIKLPDDNALLILVLDDVKGLDAAFQNVKEKYKNRLKNSEEEVSPLKTNQNRKGAVISGRMNGMRSRFEMFSYSGKQKGFIIVATYLVSEETEVRTIIQNALDSFSIKE